MSMQTTMPSSQLATIVSLLPYELRQELPGCAPPIIRIPAADEDDFVVFLVKPVMSRLYAGKAIGNIRMYDNAEQVAASICGDFMKATLFVDGDIKPGIFWVSGEHTKEDVLKNFAPDLATAMKRQTAWFRKLVQEADDEWQLNHTHRTISDIQRIAARRLKQERPWASDSHTEDKQRCKACQTILPGRVVVCPSCQCILET